VLGNGWPVWVVHHQDDSVTIVSAVRVDAARTVATAPRAEPSAFMVTWLEEPRRFVSARIVYDEYGRALGYRSSMICLDECPRIEDQPRVVTDLDTFALSFDGRDLGSAAEGRRGSIGRGPTRVDVHDLRRGIGRAASRQWIALRRRDAPDHDIIDPALPWPELSIEQARALHDGSYAIVTGRLVLSTRSEPALCGDPSASNACAACGNVRLPLRGVAGEPAATLNARRWWRDPADYARAEAGPYLEAHQASYLVRRDGAAFSLVAMGTPQGMCASGP
jgi:hypothetical protein